MYHETSWFRDTYPYELLSESLIPELLEKKPSRIRIWSAASSTGQEAYSISMVLQEFQMKNPGKLTMPVEIVGTDISKTVLDIAQKGDYDELSLSRGLSDERKRMFFTDMGQGRWQVNAKVRAPARFTELNLLQNYTLLGKFDLIFCRNVLIYFSSEMKTDILNRMAAIMNPGGYIILGGSESPTGYTHAFEMVRMNKGVVYRLKD